MKQLVKFKTSQLTKTLRRLFSILPNDSNASLALFSLSRSITTNLALENYIAESINSKPDLNVLLLWISEPCIVFGRHQNPWLECDVKRSREAGVRVVRRYSGGGCVYHDQGNLNISFLTNRLRFDRKINLNLIKESLQDSDLFEGIEFVITPRHDIFVRDREESFKITGSAARLAHKFSYHHCTLLFNVNLDYMQLLKSGLSKHISGTKATPSVPAKCMNMSKYMRNPSQRKEDDIMMLRLVESLCRRYWLRYRDTWSIEHLFEYVDADTMRSSVLAKSASELDSWQHRFGVTPKFSVNIPDVAAEIKVENGVIADATTNLDNNEFRELFRIFVGCRLDADDLKDLIDKKRLLVENNPNMLKVFKFFNKYLI